MVSPAKGQRKVWLRPRVRSQLGVGAGRLHSGVDVKQTHMAVDRVGSIKV